MNEYRMLIDGEWVEAHGGQWFESEDPYAERPWARVPRADATDVHRAVQAANRALTRGPWSEMSPSARGLLLHRFADLVERDAGRLAQTEVRDNGKLLAEMGGQLAYVPQWFRYFGGLADKVQGAVIPIDKPGFLNYTRKEPLGVIGIITPWNSPLLLLAWKLAPALAAGCTAVIKPSEFSSASTLEFARLAAEAGIPPGVVNVVTGFGDEVGAPLVAHPLVRSISFTGSDATGRRIAAAAGLALKHMSLELGGKSPNIVFDDANLDEAVDGVAAGIFAAAGQTCIAGSRLLVHESVHDEMVDRLTQLARRARLGPPTDPATQMGPIATQPQFEKIMRYVSLAREEGATLVSGGNAVKCPLAGTGRFVEPTIFTNVRPDMRIAQEEVFGPVLAVLSFADEEEAVTLANDSRFGLGAGVWTRDIGRAIRMSERIEAGTVWINTYRAVSFLSPFGGVKDSGIGRENGMEAIHAYLQTKCVWLNHGAPPANPFVLR